MVPSATSTISGFSGLAYHARMADALSKDEIYDLYAAPEVAGPWVRTVFVSTLDGSAVDDAGVSGSLGGEADSAVFAALRNLADLVLVGAGTARDEGYRPISKDDVDPAVRERLGLAPTPVLGLVSRRLDIPNPLQVPGTLIVTTEAAHAEHGVSLSDAVDVIAHGDEDIDWPRVLDDLRARGLRRINCEGGPHLHGALLETDLVDELCLTLDPSLVAGHGTRIAVSDAPVRRSMKLTHAHPVGDVLLLRYVRRR